MQNKVKNNIEIRFLESGELHLKGVIPTNKLSEVLFSKEKRGFFKEKVRSEAFKEVLERKGQAPKILINHNYSKEINSRDFKFREGEEELIFEVILEPTTELLENINKIGNMSYGFIASKDVWYDVRADRKKNYDWERTIMQFSDIKEFSILIDILPAFSTNKIYVGNSKEEVEQQEIKEIIEYMKKSIEQLKINEIEQLKSIVASLKK